MIFELNEPGRVCGLPERILMDYSWELRLAESSWNASATEKCAPKESNLLKQRYHMTLPASINHGGVWATWCVEGVWA